ncbi:hypothetical protein [Sorangium atrum]|uniref:Uncharacterized protein n=1 Tax=Sorangium atrum TaxID=2995308 RepID=A0ABT5BVL5_9BACT|nr:hypothetical protein [Sorangium aterium]MDC0677001.1 hypothetical protein [Sorangium aterium]
MNDDDLLKALARVAREQDRASDPRWSARALGTLAAGERDALEAEAQRTPEDREAWEASRPLDGEARARIADRILAGLQASAGERGAETAGAAAATGAETTGAAAATGAGTVGAEAVGPPPPGQHTAAARGGEVLPLPRKPDRAPWRTAATALAAAAAAVLIVRLSLEGDKHHPRGLLDDPGALAMLPVPAYAMTLAGGEVSERSASSGADATARLGPGSRLEITLRPATRVDGPVALRAFLIQGETARPWDVHADLSEQGAARIEGDTEKLFSGVPEGEWEIAIAIGRPAALPDSAAGLADARPSEKKDKPFRILRFKVLLLPRAAPLPLPTARPAAPSKDP